jgi:hypothetical protein
LATTIPFNKRKVKTENIRFEGPAAFGQLLPSEDHRGVLRPAKRLSFSGHSIIISGAVRAAQSYE